ncbi:MAG: nucleotidyltransferase family protein [Pirellulales bacterium]
MHTFAIIPAAGRSRRMGQPKLLLPWGNSTVIEHVLAAWRASRVDHVILVVDPSDERLAEIGAACNAQVVVPAEPPSEMKDSVRLALEWVQSRRPQSDDAWLVAPADMPGVSPDVINRLIEAHAAGLGAGRGTPRIRAPRHGTKRGHPVLFPWPLAAEVAGLGDAEGLNVLVARHGVEFVEAPPDAAAEDFDTPEEYERLRARFGQ